MRERLDHLVVKKGHAETRSRATDLIKSGKIAVNGTVVTKSAQQVSSDDEITLLESDKFVSRGAYKLKAAIEHFNIDLKDVVALDAGASTGGFTQILLENGAAKVYAVDVGHGQLVPSLKDDPRVINMEGINLRFPLDLPEKVSFISVDLSFISLALTLPPLRSLLTTGDRMVILVKPQFEAGRERVPKDGVIKDEALRQTVLEEVFALFQQENLKLEGHIVSPIHGKDGNVEYLAYLSCL